jgi:hypothetical protein
MPRDPHKLPATRIAVEELLVPYGLCLHIVRWSQLHVARCTRAYRCEIREASRGWLVSTRTAIERDAWSDSQPHNIIYWNVIPTML